MPPTSEFSSKETRHPQHVRSSFPTLPFLTHPPTLLYFPSARNSKKRERFKRSRQVKREGVTFSSTTTFDDPVLALLPPSSTLSARGTASALMPPPSTAGHPFPQASGAQSNRQKRPRDIERSLPNAPGIPLPGPPLASLAPPPLFSAAIAVSEEGPGEASTKQRTRNPAGLPDLSAHVRIITLVLGKRSLVRFFFLSIFPSFS